MTKEQIIAAARALPPEEQEAVATEIWLHVDDATKDQVWDEWSVEIARRLDAIDRGESSSVPFEEAVGRLQAKIRTRQ